MLRALPRVVGACLWVAILGCEPMPAAAPGRSAQPNLFGPDDRREWYAFEDPAFAELASRSVGAWIPESRVDESDPTNIVIGTRGTHQEVHELCPGEAFEDQPVSASCTGVLIDEDLVATAGHCFDEADDCRERRFVTRWYYEGPDTFATLTAQDVYRCREVLVVRNQGDFDHAIVRLDRPVAAPRRPVSVRYTVEDLPRDTPVRIASHGAGLPMKLDEGGRVVDFEPVFFETTSDTFGGSSGAGVFDADGTLLGLHVRGPNDYEEDAALGCSRVNRLDDDPRRTNGGDASHVALPVQELCAIEGNGSALCEGTGGDSICRTSCDCPAGTSCEVQDGNITCVTSCRDDAECAAGFACEDGRCRAGPGCFGGEVWDRDVCSRPVAFREACAPDEICDTGACVPAPPGDTCALAEDIDATNRFLRVDLVNEAYRDLHQGSCGAFGPDRVWRLTIDAPTDLSVSVRNMGYRLYIREGDCEDAGAELGCSLDNNRPRLDVSLEPGVYYVFLDAQTFTNTVTTVDFLFDVLEPEVPDAGPAHDAGVPAAPDAGEAPTDMSDGGCAVRPSAPAPAPLLLVGLLALGLLVRSRARRGR